MQKNQKIQRRKPGEHNKRNETKIEIIEFILGNNKKDNEPGIPEPKIREHLLDKFGITYQDTIRKHLKELSEDKDKACLEKFPPEKRGHVNHWDITKSEHLSNIRNKFHDVQLNKYEKSLMTVLQKNGSNIETIAGIIFYVKLLISASFFNVCLDTDINVLRKRTKGIYKFKTHSEKKRIENRLHADYTSYITHNPNVKISYETFELVMTQMSQRDDISSPEMFKKIFEEKLSEEMSDKIHRKTMGNDIQIYVELNCASFELWSYNFIFEQTSFDLLFEGCFYMDNIAGFVYEEEEMEFLIKTQANEEEERGPMDDKFPTRFNKRLLSDLEQVSKILVKYKHPSIFGDIYNNPEDTYNGLIKRFSKYLLP